MPLPTVTSVHAGTLGCGTYEVHVRTRGGGSLVAEVPWTSIEWERALDDTSAASVAAVVGRDCCEALENVRPWRHELSIYRDGAEVWVGPVFGTRFAPEEPRIEARDLTAWTDHRRIHNDYDYPASTDLAAIFEAILNDAMAPDNTPGLTVATSPSGITGALKVLAAQNLIAGSVLRDLSASGVDWTAVVRSVLAGGTAVPAASIGTFVDDHFVRPPTPVFDGSEQANSWTIAGSGTGEAGDNIYATATDAAAGLLDGLLESVDSVSTISDYDHARAAASTRVALTGSTFAVEDAILASDSPFTVAKLVPGALCHLELAETCVPVSGSYRLKSVHFSVDADGQEQVVPVFQVPGTT